MPQIHNKGRTHDRKYGGAICQHGDRNKLGTACKYTNGHEGDLINVKAGFLGKHAERQADGQVSETYGPCVDKSGPESISDKK